MRDGKRRNECILSGLGELGIQYEIDRNDCIRLMLAKGIDGRDD